MALKYRILSVPATVQELDDAGNTVTKALADRGTYRVVAEIFDDTAPTVIHPFTYEGTVPPSGTVPVIADIRADILNAIYAEAKRWRSAQLVQADLATFVGPTVRNVP